MTWKKKMCEKLQLVSGKVEMIQESCWIMHSLSFPPLLFKLETFIPSKSPTGHRNMLFAERLDSYPMKVKICCNIYVGRHVYISYVTVLLPSMNNLTFTLDLNKFWIGIKGLYWLCIDSVNNHGDNMWPFTLSISTYKCVSCHHIHLNCHKSAKSSENACLWHLCWLIRTSTV